MKTLDTVPRSFTQSHLERSEGQYMKEDGELNYCLSLVSRLPSPDPIIKAHVRFQIERVFHNRIWRYGSICFSSKYGSAKCIQPRSASI